MRKFVDYKDLLDGAELFVNISLPPALPRYFFGVSLMLTSISEFRSMSFGASPSSKVEGVP